jgi:hypothetical protein
VIHISTIATAWILILAPVCAIGETCVMEYADPSSGLTETKTFPYPCECLVKGHDSTSGLPEIQVIPNCEHYIRQQQQQEIKQEIRDAIEQNNRQNFKQCQEGCASDFGICISGCYGNARCTGNCAVVQGNCFSRCKKWQ